MSVDISVVVPTYNRPEFLDRCLRALVAQTIAPRRYEVIVADDAASERTWQQVLDFALRYRETGPAIHYLPVCATRGPAAARNAGWRQARGQIIAFTDDDCLPEPDWLAAGLRAFTPGVSSVSGRIVMPLSERPTDYEWNAAGLTTAAFVTANAFFRRTALEAVGGFDERFTMAWREDSDLWFNLLERGEQLVTAPDAVVLHPIRPARWGISLDQQRKSRFNALLYKKHPRLYRQYIQSAPPLDYYGAVASLVAILGGAGARRPLLVAVGGASWFALTSRFVARRLRETSHAPAHVAEMLVTSMAIPPLAVYWRLRGAWEYRVAFL